MSTTSILTSNQLFNQVPQISTYPNIQCLIAAQTPLATILNGQGKLREFLGILQKNNAGQQDPTIKFNQIASQYQFNLFKQMVPKLIFSRYTSRQFPGMNNSSSTITNSDYASEVMFKIDFDSSVVSDMIALITLNMAVDTSALVDSTLITIQGYSSKSTKGATTVRWADVLSLQFSYIEDFLYHWISSVDIGFCNTGGSNPIWHQRVPIEIAWIYHRIILPQEMGTTIKRLTRDDAFTIGHDPFHIFGNFMYQMKASNDLNNQYGSLGQISDGKYQGFYRGASNADGMNEIAMYYIEDTIKGIDMAKVGRSTEANASNWTIGRNPQAMDFQVIDIEQGNVQRARKFQLISQLEDRFFGDHCTNITVSFDGNTSTYNKVPIMYIASTENIPAAKVVNYMERIKYAVPHTDNNCYLCPIVRLTVSDHNNALAMGFMVYMESTEAIINFPTTITISATPEQYFMTDTSSRSMVITIHGGVGRVNTVNLTGEDEEESKEVTTTISMGGFQIARDRYVSAIIAVGQKTISINDIANYSNATDMSYVLSDTGYISAAPNSAAFSGMYSYMAELLGITNSTIKTMLSATQTEIFKKSGMISPYINVGSLNYMLVESNNFDLNDFGWDAMYKMYYSNNVDSSIYPPQSADMINDMFRYNMAMLNNKENEEFSPTIRNPDYVSIHTFRKDHGIVDFYFPLNFLFICQGLNTGFPHYACASQSIMIKFQFYNPKAFINTCLVVRPTAVDALDTTQNARVYINRINTYSLFTTNYTDMRMVLFYNRYVWVPELADVITNYTKYTWILRNYERIYHSIGGEANGPQVLYEFNRSVFYTKIWMFIVNTDTYDKIQGQGGITQTQPLYVNKYHLPVFDVTQFQEATSQYKANSLVGNDLTSWNKQYNSPYGMVPVDSFQLITNSTISMMDVMPYRLQQFVDFVTLDHTQCHQPILNNNLIQFNIDPIYYQMETPNSTYSPAYAPAFQLKYTPKLNSGYNRKYGAIIISECVNISYINNHVMLSKYQTDS